MSEQRLGNPMDYILSENDNPTSTQSSDQSSDSSANNFDKSTNNSSPQETPSISRREGDSGLGIPQSQNDTTRTLSPEETKAYQKKLDQEARLHAEEMMTLLQAEEGWRLPKPLRKALASLALLTASLLGLLIITQSVQFFGEINNFSPATKWSFLAFFSLFSLIILWAIFSLFSKFLWLQTSPQIRPKALKVLAERKHLQVVAKEKQAEAQKLLKQYLEKYPLNQEQQRKFYGFGMTAHEFENLANAQRKLLLAAQPVNPADWCDDFQKSFQSMLDDFARKRIKQYGLRAAVGTATSPMPMVDRMIMLYSSVAMIKDLLTIYNLRPSTSQSIFILSRAILMVYLSGMLEEGTQNVVDNISEAFGDLGDGGIGALGGALGATVSAKAAEAGLNLFFLNRLGKKTIQVLQPSRLD